MNPFRHRRSAFTLIEIMIVIVILGVLAAILFPVFNKAREESRKAACASNLKQLGAAVRLYVDDWKRLPVMQPVAAPKAKLVEVFGSYTKNLDVYRCRSDAAKYWQTTGDGSSYGWNPMFDGLRLQKPSFMGIDLSKAPCIGDAQSWHALGGPKGGKNALCADGAVQFIIAP